MRDTLTHPDAICLQAVVHPVEFDVLLKRFRRRPEHIRHEPQTTCSRDALEMHVGGFCSPDSRCPTARIKVVEQVLSCRQWETTRLSNHTVIAISSSSTVVTNDHIPRVNIKVRFLGLEPSSSSASSPLRRFLELETTSSPSSASSSSFGHSLPRKSMRDRKSSPSSLVTFC